MSKRAGKGLSARVDQAMSQLPRSAQNINLRASEQHKAPAACVTNKQGNSPAVTPRIGCGLKLLELEACLDSSADHRWRPRAARAPPRNTRTGSEHRGIEARRTRTFTDLEPWVTAAAAALTPSQLHLAPVVRLPSRQSERPFPLRPVAGSVRRPPVLDCHSPLGSAIERRLSTQTPKSPWMASARCLDKAK